jgi:hypothetical protein
MAYDWLAFRADAMTALRVGMPTAVPGGLYTSQALARTSWEVPTAYPYLVLHQGVAPAGDWGITNDAFEPVVDVYLIVAETVAQEQDPDSAENQIHEGLEAIKNAMRAATFTNSQASLLEVSEIDWGPLLDVNAILLGKNVPVLGGRISFRFTLGETAS